MDKILSTIPITFQKIQSYDITDTRFTKVKIKLMHLGLNLNNSIFTKEVVTAALPSLCNTPILGYVKVDENGDRDFSDHHSVLVIEGKEIKVVYKGSAYGTIPESCNPRFENELCSDGIEREYLVIDGLLWNKLDGVDIFCNDVVKKESMELAEDSIVGKFDNEGHFVFEKFLFSGACALGDDVTPAMIGASISTNFTINLEEIKAKLEQFNNYFTQSQTQGVDINNNGMKGGNNLTTETIEAIFAEYNLTSAETGIEVTDEMTEETLREMLTGFACKKKKEKFDAILEEFGVTETELGEFDTTISEEDLRSFVSAFVENKKSDATKTNEPQDTPVVFSTYGEKRDALFKLLPNKRVLDDGVLISGTFYYINDLDDSYLYVEKEELKEGEWYYSYGRFPYSEDGRVFTLGETFEPMTIKWLTMDEAEKIEKDRATFEAEFERLKAFESKTIKDKFDADAAVVFSRFDEKLSSSPEYVSLKENYDGMTIESIEDKCFSIYGRYSANFSVNNDPIPTVSVGIDNNSHVTDDDDDDGYGGLLARKYK